jgi:16S rRNA (cytidine1402-2'-O)-methyltransferase
MAPDGPGTLYLVATPIGNLEDISLRALRILGEVALIAAEDTRHTRKLLTHHKISARMVSLHEHNEQAQTPSLLARLQSGESIAVVSDAGTPGLSDPGTALVNAAAAAGIPVITIPGPNAFIAALVVSGLPPTPVTFLGFLPSTQGERQRVLETVRSLPHTLVFYEAPHRLLETLQALCAVWGEGRQAAVAREMTKVHEEVLRGSLRDALEYFSAHPPRGEFTLVVEGAPAAGAAPAIAVPDLVPPEEVARKILREALAANVRPLEAVHHAARASGLRRNEVYQLWLQIKQEGKR